MQLVPRSPFQIASVALAAWLAAVPAAQAQVALPLTLTATPGHVVVNASGPLAVDVDLPQAIGIEGITLNLDWNPALVLRFDATQSTVFGTRWADLQSLVDWTLSSPPVDDPGHFGLSVILLGPVPLPAGVAPLSLVFQGLQVGSHDVQVQLELAHNGGADSLFGSTTGTVNVTAVPEPTPGALLLAGVGVLGWLARRRAA